MLQFCDLLITSIILTCKYGPICITEYAPDSLNNNNNNLQVRNFAHIMTTAFFYWLTSTILLFSTGQQLVMKSAVDIDHCTFLGQRRPSYSFIHGRRPPLPFSTGRHRPSCSFLSGQRCRRSSTSILQPFSSRPFVELGESQLLLKNIQRKGVK